MSRVLAGAYICSAAHVLMLGMRFSYRGEEYRCDARSRMSESEASLSDQGRSGYRVNILDTGHATGSPQVWDNNMMYVTPRLTMKPESLSRAFGKLRDCGVSVRQCYTNIVVLREFALEGPANSWSKM